MSSLVAPAQPNRAWAAAFRELWPEPLCQSLAAFRWCTRLSLIHPVIAHNDIHVSARFPVWDTLHIEQRIPEIANFAIPASYRRKACVIGGHDFGQQALCSTAVSQHLQIALTECQIRFGVAQIHIVGAHVHARGVLPYCDRRDLHQSTRVRGAYSISAKNRFLQRQCEGERRIDLPSGGRFPASSGIAQCGNRVSSTRRIVRHPELCLRQTQLASEARKSSEV